MLNQADIQANINQVKAIFTSYLRAINQNIPFIKDLLKIKGYLISGTPLPDRLKTIDIKNAKIPHSPQEIHYVRQHCLWQCVKDQYKKYGIPEQHQQQYQNFLQETHAALTKKYQQLPIHKLQNKAKAKSMVAMAALGFLILNGFYSLYKKYFLALTYDGILIAISASLLKKFTAELVSIAAPPPHTASVVSIRNPNLHHVVLPARSSTSESVQSPHEESQLARKPERAITTMSLIATKSLSNL